MSFLYFVADCEPSRAIESAGIGYAFEVPGRKVLAQVHRGPGGKRGALALDPHRVPGNHHGYHADRQTWRPWPGKSGVWVGRPNETTIGPAELARVEQLSGDKVELGDGCDWLVPTCRSWSESDDPERFALWSNRLPAVLTLDDAGEWIHGDVIAKYAQLARIAEAVTEVTFLAEAAREEMRRRVVGEQRVFSAAILLQANYVVGPVEAAMLGLFDSHNVGRILDVAADVGGLIAIAEKKSAERRAPAMNASPASSARPRKRPPLSTHLRRPDGAGVGFGPGKPGRGRAGDRIEVTHVGRWKDRRRNEHRAGEGPLRAAAARCVVRQGIDGRREAREGSPSRRGRGEAGRRRIEEVRRQPQQGQRDAAGKVRRVGRPVEGGLERRLDRAARLPPRIGAAHGRIWPRHRLGSEARREAEANRRRCEGSGRLREACGRRTEEVRRRRQGVASHAGRQARSAHRQAQRRVQGRAHQRRPTREGRRAREGEARPGRRRRREDGRAIARVVRRKRRRFLGEIRGGRLHDSSRRRASVQGVSALARGS